ncbi:3424_t:CDS:10 [Entrophospora sp. SA101]|nr:3424_t:CDS:10 [Entrophospora sp. SA101]CAJ0840148.1 773_t:CDS:10 [Entrophospora sp. SA101]
MSIYPLYKDLFPPTGVEEVVCASFTSPTDINLIVARSSILQIYRFVEQAEVTKEEETAMEEDVNLVNVFGKDDDQNFIFPTLKPAANLLYMTARLELIIQYKLHGNITSMGVVQTISSGANGMDSLLISFKDAKLSLLEFSLATNSIVTVSIHYYEREEFKLEFLSNPFPTKVKVDSSSSCAVLHFYGDKLAILPFRQEALNLDEEDAAIKWPYVPSFVVELSSIQSKIKNIIDMNFLNDYYEPTLAILFEPCQTWPGKLNSQKDTCSLIVISLDIAQKKYPIIYSMDNLPHSCVKTVPVPKPIGGILIITANALIHVIKNSPGIGVSVNGYASSTTDFPLDSSFEHLGITLEGCKHVFLTTDEILLALRNGDLYLAKLIKDGRSVSKISLEKVGNDTLPSCACYITDGYFFLGSRLGDSHLIQYKTLKIEPKSNGVVNGFGYQSRRNTLDFETELYNTDVINNTIKNDDISKNSKSSTKKDYIFTLCDTLLNVGPIVGMTYGELVFSEEKSHMHNIKKDLELVTCSGYGKGGSICVFHHNINPVVFSSFAMDGCLNMWAISSIDPIFAGIPMDTPGLPNHLPSIDSEQSYDKYLFISKSFKTMVLACGEELQELEHSDFYTEGPTIEVGSLLNNSLILQVHPYGLKLLNSDSKQIISIDKDPGNGLIVFASIVDPYILLLYDTGIVDLMKIDNDTKEINSCELPSHINELPIANCCIFYDESDLFALVKDVEPLKKFNEFNNFTKKNKPSTSMPIDDELDELFNESKSNDDDLLEANDEMVDDDLLQVVGEVNEENVSGVVKNTKRESYWCVIYRQDGSLEIYKLPELQEVFHFPHFDMTPTVLVGFFTRQNIKTPGKTADIQEILLKNLGLHKKDTYLIARTSVGDIIIYKAFRYIPGSDIFDPFQKSQSQGELSDHLAIRFSRVSHEYISRESIYSDIHDKPVSSKNNQQDINEIEEEQIKNNLESRKEQLRLNKRRLIPFSNIAGFTGVFVTGAKPVWIICANNNFLRLHPMNADGEIKSFTPFHNVHCKNGFLYTNNEDDCRFSELSKEFLYDMEWPVRKISLGRSVHGIEYHPEMQVYALMTSTPIEFHMKDENGVPTDVDGDSSQFLPETQNFTLELISPITWETVDKHDFQEDEQGLCIKCVSLQTKSTSSGRKPFIAVGTGFFRGEDVGMRGNIYVFEIIEVVPEPDNPQTNHKFKLLCAEEVKGSVTTICDVNGYLLTCVGPKIFIRAFEDNDCLISVAFIDIQLYASNVVSIKDFILLGDVYKSVWFLGFQEEPAKLVLVGKDYNSLEVSCLSFLIDEPALYFVVADMDKNIHMFQYAPYNVQSFAGQKLIRRGDFHVGSQVKTMLTLPKKEVIRKDHDFDLEFSSKTSEEIGTLDGSIGMITPITEKTYKRMQLLYSQMVNGIQHPAGLNPKSFRLLQSKMRLAINPSKGILDGDLLFQFPNLALHRQREMTKQIGTTVERIMDDLLAIQESYNYF